MRRYERYGRDWPTGALCAAAALGVFVSAFTAADPDRYRYLIYAGLGLAVACVAAAAVRYRKRPAGIMLTHGDLARLRRYRDAQIAGLTEDGAKRDEAIRGLRTQVNLLVTDNARMHAGLSMICDAAGKSIPGPLQDGTATQPMAAVKARHLWGVDEQAG